MSKTSNKGKTAAALDVDTRFLLANERTLLAWVRTALTLMIGGLALTQFGDKTATQARIGLLTTVFAILMTVLAYIRYKMTDSAIRRGHLPATGSGPLLQVVGILGFALAILVFESFQGMN